MYIRELLLIKGTKHIKRHKGLEEKRGKAKGPGLGGPRTKPEDSEAKIKRLEAENEMLKKLLGM
ncbi:hypothetical protein [Bacillus sp. BR_16]|uniref:hypothetical protein n=1 Tax=Bacillus sp. BR_16 TaxID=3055777 RepID=UPI0035C2213B